MTDRDELREHDFDGIQEYDNDLPRWWIWLFVLTVIFSIIYPFIYDFGPGQFASETVDAEMLAIRQSKEAIKAKSGEITEDLLLKLTTDSKILADGQLIYSTRCLPCHGDKGQGLIGPNLTDQNWIHGGKITDIHKVISDGVLAKGMLAWKDQLTPEQLNSVVAFVWSIHGTNPPNPKAPEGNTFTR